MASPIGPTVHCVLPAADIVGESLIWSAVDQALLWVDIGGRRIHRLEPATGRHETWPTPEFPTSIGLRATSGAVVGLTRRVALWHFNGRFETLAVPEPDLPDNRLNEGKVGPDGCFWIGTMQNNLADDGSPRDMTRDSGAIYRVHADGRVQAMTARAFGITNTFAWLGDGRLVTADTTKNQLYAYGYDPAQGLSPARLPFGAPFARGLPDGSCLDAEGFLWNCRVVGGACIVRFAPDGSVDRVVDLPCTWPTSCAFGGPDLATLYVTSARFTMSRAHLEQQPLEGGLFAFEPGVRGRPEALFAG